MLIRSQSPTALSGNSLSHATCSPQTQSFLRGGVRFCLSPTQRLPEFDIFLGFKIPTLFRRASCNSFDSQKRSITFTKELLLNCEESYKHNISANVYTKIA